MASNPLDTTPDPNGDRICNHRWNHRDETTSLDDNELEWCSACLTNDLQLKADAQSRAEQGITPDELYPSQ